MFPRDVLSCLIFTEANLDSPALLDMRGEEVTMEELLKLHSADVRRCSSRKMTKKHDAELADEDEDAHFAHHSGFLDHDTRVREDARTKQNMPHNTA